MRVLEVGRVGLIGQIVTSHVETELPSGLDVVVTGQIVQAEHGKVVVAHLRLVQRGLVGHHGQTAMLPAALHQ